MCLEGMEVKPFTVPTLVNGIGVTAVSTPYVSGMRCGNNFMCRLLHFARVNVTADIIPSVPYRSVRESSGGMGSWIQFAEEQGLTGFSGIKLDTVS